ncbi:MAG: hypothetical protein JHC52_01290, partial [Chthoniobacterales bacterium]|nr:hypothetical protein [Chthoniobacterales bacterium]
MRLGAAGGHLVSNSINIRGGRVIDPAAG